MENPKNQLATKLKEANNVLVTVSTNPSVDQLAAAIGLTLFLTKLKKHATTVFSGQVPSTIDFLKPEETIENNTDSLRDFIISLDKNKADKIRYKVEDTMVKIFITPYRTSIGETDLVFSQGDFNVDVVIGIGIHNKEDIDQAIMAHGRILHDATVATVNTKDGSDIGTLNWVDQQASSLCEMAVALTDLIKANSLDGQMATAFLTGIVAETERFSNEKTTSTTMNASAKLMAAGANQQLVATKLQPPEEEPPAPTDEPKGPSGGDVGGESQDATVDDDGALRIDHESVAPPADKPEGPDPAAPPSDTLPEPVMPEPNEPEPTPVSQVHISEDGQLQVEEPKIKQDHREFLGRPGGQSEGQDIFGLAPTGDKSTEDKPAGAAPVAEPPKFGGQLSAAADDSSAADSPLNLPPVNTPILSHDSGSAKSTTAPPPSMPPNLPPAAEPAPAPQPPKPPATTGKSYVDMGDKTLDAIEEKVDSPHQADKQTKLPEQFVKTLDNSTLTGLEEKVDSPHLKSQPDSPGAKEEIDYHKVAAEQAAKAMSDKTLGEIEEKVDSPHLSGQKSDAPTVLPPAESAKKDDDIKLDYEPIESEPPETTAKTEEKTDDTAADDEKSSEEAVPSDDAVTKDDATAADETTKDESKSDDANAAESPNKPDAGLGDEKAEEARDAVMQAIGTGGDGRSSLPALEGVGTNGLMGVEHSEEQADDKPVAKGEPPATPPPLVTITDKLPADDTASPTDDASAPPPVPPPMMPPAPQPQKPSSNIHIDEGGNLSFAPNEDNHDLPQAA